MKVLLEKTLYQNEFEVKCTEINVICIFL